MNHTSRLIVKILLLFGICAVKDWMTLLTGAALARCHNGRGLSTMGVVLLVATVILSVGLSCSAAMLLIAAERAKTPSRESEPEE